VDCDVYVQDSAVRYLAPVWTDFIARARLAEGETWAAFAAMLAGARTRPPACVLRGDAG